VILGIEAARREVLYRKRARRPLQQHPRAEIDQFDEVMREKRRQKEELVLLSNNSIAVTDPQSGHHIQLEDPAWLTAMLLRELDTVRRHLELK
jgi:hypothetical protein